MFKRKRISSQAIVISSLAVSGLASMAAAGWLAHRYGIFPFQSRRRRWISKSRKPQISRWQSEGGDVPQVSALRPRYKH